MHCKLTKIFKVVHVVFGISAGLCGCVVFATIYGNINASVWAGISMLVALAYARLAVQMNRCVHRGDLERITSPTYFFSYMIFAGVLMLAGIVVVITFLTIGITDNEDLSPKGSYVVIVWGAMTFKWSLFLLLLARKFRKKYYSTEENQPVISICDSDVAA